MSSYGKKLKNNPTNTSVDKRITKESIQNNKLKSEDDGKKTLLKCI